MLATKSPTMQEMEQVNETIHRYAQANKATIDRERKAFSKQMEKDRFLAKECEQVSIEIYKQIMDALPDQRSKELFAHYSLLASGKNMLSHAMYTDTKRAYSTFTWVVKKVKKLLSEKTK